MSLLNDVLHNLAKQETSRQRTPILNPASSPAGNARMVIIILASFALVLFVIILLILTRQTTLKTIKVTENKHAIKQNVSKTDVVSSDVKASPRENINNSSYIEPMSSQASFREALQLPESEDELLNDWVDTQDEIHSESLSSVNKIYAPLTLDEWHDAQLNKALKAIDEGFDERAVEILEAILIKIPNAVDVRENLASLYLSFDDYASTTRVVTEGLKYSPADAALITIKARLLLDQGKAEAAIKLLSGFRPSLRSYPDFYGTLAAALQSEGRVMEAGSLYKALIQVDPDNGQYWLGYGISLERNHKSNQAIEAYSKAIQNPESDPSVRNYAEIRLKTLQG